MDNQNTVKVPPQYIVGIGASAGGLEAIEAFFKNMPANSGLSFVVIQHLSPQYKSLMAELLSKHTAMPVRRIEDGMKIERNTVYLIPPRKNVTVFHNQLLLAEQDPSKGINLPIDIFLRSLSEDARELAVGIILSGTGSDGTRGIRAIKEFGGMVMVQDENSAKFDGMPKNAFATGLADFSLPPEKMPGQLLAFVKHPYATLQEKNIVSSDDSDITRIFSILREKCKIDFTFYKPNTVVRRIERRISINHLKDISEYLNLLQTNPHEVLVLFQELLIGVTSFFRDEHVFDDIREHWLKKVVKLLQEDELRVWVTACSTGEEAYSLAMLLSEYREYSGHYFRVKIFATDVDLTAIEKASNGKYPESIIADIPPKLLSKYFIRREDYFQVSQKIREMVVFAQHNLIKDPPFTNIHILSCRNVLIYLQPVLQKKILELFNFSLVKEGLLVLGTSETIGDMGEYFDVASAKSKLYRSKGKYKSLGFTASPSALMTYAPYPSSVRSSNALSGQEERVLDRFIRAISNDVLPFTMIINENMEISHIFGDSKDYLSYPSGKLVSNVSKIVKKDLSIPISTGIQKALKANNEIVLSNIRVREQDSLRTFRLQFKPLPGKKGQEILVAAMITETVDPSCFSETETLVYDVNLDAKQRIIDLEQELQFTRENLQATVEELETSNEELQATNEELLASNEELQSTNEELQSVNEELYTVNAEHQGKIVELTLLNNDLDNLFNSTNIATLFLDENLDIRRFTPKLQSIFHILETDLGRPFYHLTHTIKDLDVIAVVKGVNDQHNCFDQEIQLENGTWYLLRVIPYVVSAKVNAGVILTFVDINQLKSAQLELHKREEQETLRLAKFVQFSNDAITLLEPDGTIVTWNHAAEKLYGWSAHEALGMNFYNLIPDDEKHFAKQGLSNLKVGNTLPSFQAKRLSKSGKVVHVSASACMFQAENSARELIALTERDYVHQHQVEKQECLNCLQKLATIVMDTDEAIILFEVSGKITAWNKGAEILYGWDSLDAASMTFAEIVSDDERGITQQLIQELILVGGVKSIKTKRITKDQKIIPVRMHATVLGNRSGEALLIVSSEKAVH
ncbi:chemotaxis protein CheB [Methylomonas sp. OY6]|uniref:protein-glutamate O-methyltransferase n=1 Tax=Methylomonas defluvii TaxID=3045149 RepID=A0ABU4UJZ2_9GAMM|nr:chemotaxis protein CheB [Methylomonas sp. OY6]MDX8129826.1 chemotaxis protein CheB [Methylomonas sp. OY6]